MAKHSYDAESMTPCQIMSSVRVHRDGGTVGFISSFGCEDFEVPARPTGAHRQGDNDGWVNPNAVLLIKDPKYGPVHGPVHGPSFECPREWHEGFAVEFEYITVPRV